MGDLLVSRLLAEIDRRVELAEAAIHTTGEWEAAGTFLYEDDYDGDDIAHCNPGVTEHVEVHDPAAVLRMCQAHRKVVELCSRKLIHVGTFRDHPDDPAPKTVEGGREPWGMPVLLALAEGYGITTEEDS